MVAKLKIKGIQAFNADLMRQAVSGRYTGVF